MFVKSIVTLTIVLSVLESIDARPETPSVVPQPPAPQAVSGYNYEPVVNPLSEYGPPKVPFVIEKHVYVHVPPADNAPARLPSRPVPARIPKKHYKVVFIKAPTPAPISIPEIPVQQQDEEQTLIYVLVKNHEKPEIKIPIAPASKPNKPEVYFIKYETKNKPSKGPYPDRVPDVPAAISSGSLPPPPSPPPSQAQPQQLSDSYGVPKN